MKNDVLWRRRYVKRKQRNEPKEKPCPACWFILKQLLQLLLKAVAWAGQRQGVGGSWVFFPPLFSRLDLWLAFDSCWIFFPLNVCVCVSVCVSVCVCVCVSGVWPCCCCVSQQDYSPVNPTTFLSVFFWWLGCVRFGRYTDISEPKERNRQIGGWGGTHFFFLFVAKHKRRRKRRKEQATPRKEKRKEKEKRKKKN